ncbi:MAG: NADPH-dependent FMN reductase, partial [Pseudomonadota bacterium]
GSAAQFKAFMDAMASRWYTQAWNGKWAGGFTASSLASGDKLNCLQDLVTFAMQMGMIWVGTGTTMGDELNPNGYYLGVGASASSAEQLGDVDINTAKHLGRRIAKLASSLPA